MLLPVSFSPTHSSLSLSPPMSPSSQPVVHHENEPCNWVQKDNWEPRFQDTQEVTERKRWPSSSLLIRDVPTSYSVPVSSNYAGSSRSLPGSRHHYRNSLRALRNMTLLPGGIRISRETGEDLAPVFDFDEDSLNGGDENAGIGTASSRSLRLLCLESSMEGVGSSRTSQRTSKTRRGHKRSATAPHILTNSLRTAALHRV